MIHDGLWDPYHNCPMGMAAEKCAADHGFGREAQDDYAALSYQRAQRATVSGYTALHIAALHTAALHAAALRRSGGERMAWPRPPGACTPLGSSSHGAAFSGAPAARSPKCRPEPMIWRHARPRASARARMRSRSLTGR